MAADRTPDQAWASVVVLSRDLARAGRTPRGVEEIASAIGKSEGQTRLYLFELEAVGIVERVRGQWRLSRWAEREIGRGLRGWAE